MKDKIIRKKAVLEMIACSSATLHRRIKDGLFPAPLRLGENSVGWLESSVAAYLNGLQVAEPREVAPGSRKGRKPKTAKEA